LHSPVSKLNCQLVLGTLVKVLNAANTTKSLLLEEDWLPETECAHKARLGDLGISPEPSLVPRHTPLALQTTENYL